MHVVKYQLQGAWPHQRIWEKRDDNQILLRWLLLSIEEFQPKLLATSFPNISVEIWDPVFQILITTSFFSHLESNKSNFSDFYANDASRIRTDDYKVGIYNWIISITIMLALNCHNGYLHQHSTSPYLCSLDISPFSKYSF